MKKLMVKLMGMAMVMTAMSVALVGCGQSSETAATQGNSNVATASTADGGDRTKVSVGIGNMFVPFCYLDENENLAGYDYEVMLAVADKLADTYEFVMTPDDFSNLLIGLDTKKYDMAIHHFGYTAARAENYLYAEEPDMYFGSFHVGYTKERTDISDLASCAGLTIVTSSGSMAGNLLLNWNEANPEQAVKLEYATDKPVIAAGLKNGLYDAYVASKYDLDVFSAQFDDMLAYSDYSVTPEAYNDGAYFIYQKGFDTLQQAHRSSDDRTPRRRGIKGIIISTLRG